MASAWDLQLGGALWFYLLLVGVLLQAMAPLSGGEVEMLNQSDVCGALVANVTDLCRDFVTGDAPPSPGPRSPCCMLLQTSKSQLPCLCGRVDFAKLNQRALLFVSIFCRVPINDLNCPAH